MRCAPVVVVALLNAAVVAALAGTAGCEAVDGPPTYARDVKPILDARCVACHQEGSAGPFPLTTWDEVQPHAAAIDHAVKTREMPPWLAGDGCTDYVADRSLPDDEIATIGAWFEHGAAAGDLTTVTKVEVAPPDLPRVDLALDLQGPFVAAKLDEYRCFTVELPLDAPTYVTGYDVVAGDPSIVHHVNVFTTAPEHTASFLAKQDDDALPGFDCGLGRMATGSGLLGAWAPGATAVVYPEDSGILLAPGSSLVLEVHYHVEGGRRLEDQSSILLMTSDTVSKRGIGGAIYDFLNWPAAGGMTIPAGDDDSAHEFELDPLPFVGQIAPWLTSDRVKFHIVGLHMHYLGKSASLYVRRPDENVCMLDIPDWDFHWQMGYQLAQPVELLLGRDTIYVECRFDNSAANQPVIDGAKQEVVERRWGEKTTDEMCMGLFYVTEE